MTTAEEEPAHTGPPVPDTALADLTDAQQVELIEPTDNDLGPADTDLPQPGPDYVPEAG